MTIKEIAKELNISIGTIDRVIHNRGRVSAETRARVEAYLREIGFVPNRNGQALAASARKRKLAIILPFHEDDIIPFNKRLLEGLQSSYGSLEDANIEVREFLHKYTLGSDILAILDEAEEWQADAFIILSKHDTTLTQRLQKLQSAGALIITLNTDLPNSQRQYFVGYDNYAGGRVAMQMLSYMLGSKGRILVLAGSQEEESHYQRLQGALSYLREELPYIELLNILYEGEAYSLSADIFCGEAAPDGVLALSVQAAHVADLVNQAQSNRTTRIGVFDSLDIHEEYLRNRRIDFIIDQDPLSQSKKAISRVRNHFLFSNVKQSEKWFSRNTVILRENLNSFAEIEPPTRKF